MRFRLAMLPLMFAVAPVHLFAQMPGAADPKRITAGTYSIDPNHTQVTWKVNHLGFSMLQGQFGAWGGTLKLSPADLTAAKVDVTFDMTQLRTSFAAFTKHLNSSDFFDTGKFGTATFVSSSVRPGPNNTATIVGNLTIKDVTRPVTLQVKLVGAGDNPMGDTFDVGFLATGTIKRSEFGLGMAVPAVSDEVTLEINAAFTKD